MTKTRDLFWDTVKFILIFLVLYGHFIQPFRENSPFNMTMFNFRYTFHMSLFVFISGKFSHISDPKKYRKGILKIIETYVVFQCALCLTSYLMGEKPYWGMLTTPRFALWYLVALLYYRIFVYVLEYKRIAPATSRHSTLIILIVSILLSVVAPMLPIGGHFAIKRAMTWAPFFVLGYFSDGIDIKSIIKRIPIWLSVLYFIVIFVALYIGLQYHDINLGTLVHWSFVYGGDGVSVYLIRVLIRFLFIPFTILSSAMVMRLIPTINRIDKLGKNITMFIFIYHMFAVYLLVYLVSHGVLVQNEILLFIYSVIATVILVLLSKIKFFNILLNPITYFVQKKENTEQNK